MSTGANDSPLRSGDEETRRAAVAALSGDDDSLRLLVEALGDESWRVRKEAVLRAAAWTDPGRAARVLVEALAERDNVGRRNAAVEALSRLGPVALEPLLAALAARPDHRKLIVDTLGLLSERRAVPALVPALDDPDVNVRGAAAESLGRLGGPEAEQALAAQIDGGELLVSLTALEALTALGARLPVARVAPLIDTAVLRPAALAALGCSGDPAAAPILVASLADKSRSVRDAATGALARLHDSLEGATRGEVAAAASRLGGEAVHFLVTALLEGASAMRRAAATILGLSGSASAVRPLVLALGDYAVEEAAGAALLRLGPAAVAPIAAMIGELDAALRAAFFRLAAGFGPDPRLEGILRAGLEDDDVDAAAEAARALGEIGGPASVASLFDALDGGLIVAASEAALGRLATRLPDEVRSRIGTAQLEGAEAPRYCRILGACRRPEDAPSLIELSGSAPSPELRAAAAEALGQVGSAASAAEGATVEAALVRVLSDPAPGVRAAAARALAGFRTVASVAALEHALSDSEPSVRAAAASALGALGLPNALVALRRREPTEEDPLVRGVIEAALHGSSPSSAAR